MKTLTSVGIGLASLILASGYAMNSLGVGALSIAIIGLLWLMGQRRGSAWTASWGLIFFSGMAAFGSWSGLPAVLMLCGTVAALASWDLDDFSGRQERAQRVEGQRQLERSHLRRLLIVSALGLLLGGVALGFGIQLSFWWAFLLGLLALLGLGRTIGFFRRESL